VYAYKIKVVIDVVDIERQEMFQLLQNLPNEESRVIGVIYKCDTKQKKSHGRVFDLIRNDPSQSKHYLKEAGMVYEIGSLRTGG